MNPIYFISDIHLSSVDSPITRSFFDLLDNKIDTPSSLYILGDLFEVWIGDDDENAFIEEIKKILIDFTANGPETFFMHGNRDFLLGENFANQVGISLLPDPYILDINGLKVILSHGDFLCTDDVDYIHFRNQVRSEDWQNDFLSKNIEERKQIAQSLRSDSKKATSDKSLEITDANLETVNKFIKEHSPDIFIHGHTHRPKIHQHDSTKRIVLGDWYKRGWLASIDNKECDLKEFKI